MVLKLQIEQVHKTDPSYGHRRVAIKLGINHKRVARVMRKYGLKPPRRRSQRKHLTVSTNYHSYRNLMKDVELIKINQVWVSDLTYIKYRQRFIYLATVLDAYSREILSARLGRQHNAELALQTTKAAVGKESDTPDIFHSDQGKEFMAKRCTGYLEQLGSRVSVSDTASPWQNGYQESFFSRFKAEIGDLNRFKTLGELSEEVYSYIDYYNTRRIHTSLKMPPKTFRQLS